MDAKKIIRWNSAGSTLGGPPHLLFWFHQSASRLSAMQIYREAACLPSLPVRGNEPQPGSGDLAQKALAANGAALQHLSGTWDSHYLAARPAPGCAAAQPWM